MTPGLRIGEAAARARVSTRTLRYYQELGLLAPSAYSPGGARRYSDQDVEALLRIRDLQEMLGFDLEQIQEFLSSERRLNELRQEFQGDRTDPRRQEQLVREAIVINDRLRADVRGKIARTTEFLAELEGKARKYRQFLKSVRGSTVASR